MEWTSVKDRLPEGEENKVLVCCKNGYIGLGCYKKLEGVEMWFDLETWNLFSRLDGNEGHFVTHWMPLPKPPES